VNDADAQITQLACDMVRRAMSHGDRCGSELARFIMDEHSLSYEGISALARKVQLLTTMLAHGAGLAAGLAIGAECAGRPRESLGEMAPLVGRA
jgi:hypothetical protein